jgi:hypothetical protein
MIVDAELERGYDLFSGTTLAFTQNDWRKQWNPQ